MDLVPRSDIFSEYWSLYFMLLWTFMGRFILMFVFNNFVADKNLHLPGEKNDLQVQLVSKSREYN
jgi:hypothetical protein